MPVKSYKRSVELLEASAGGALVALNAEAGECFGFNEVAASVWRSLAQPKTFAELRDELVDVYDVAADQCTADLHHLLAQMISQGLVEETSPEIRGPSAS